jgi:hypothetical protein
MTTDPLSVDSKPAMIRSSVVFPPPLGPSRAVSWPVGTLRLMFSSATKSPKRLLTFVTSMLMHFSFGGWRRR